MGIATFLAALLQDGRVWLDDARAPSAEETPALDELLTAFEADYRRELPGRPPSVSLPAARWGATMVYRACQFLAFRDVDEAAIRAALAEPCPGAHDAAAHYSVDLTLRFLPEIHRRAKAASERDPLVECLQELAADWPLSSVGVPATSPVRSGGVVVRERREPLLSDPCLLRVYVDRIIAGRNVERLDDPRVRDAVREALGMFRELAPELYDAVQPAAPQDAPA